MTPKQILQHFTAKSGKLNLCERPMWNNHIIQQREYSYATDGRICVRIRGNFYTEIQSKIKNAPYGIPDFGDLGWNYFEDSAFFNIKPNFSNGKKCRRCEPNGVGYINVCPECEGFGEVEFWNEFNFYEFECKTCEGRKMSSYGLLPTHDCTKCNGAGFVFDDINDLFKFKNGTNVSKNYLYLIFKLVPDAVFCLIGECEQTISEMVGFKGQGIEGILMPMRLR